jgi:uncharacterized membrane protein
MRTGGKRLAALTYAAVLILVVVWIAGIIWVPLLSVNGEHPTVLSILHYTYGRVCHQIDARSFHLDGHPFAVCARCFGIYFGYLVGLIVYPFKTSLARIELPDRSWLIASLAPVGVDVASGYLGIYESTLVTRSLTGFIAGAAGTFYTLPGLVSLAASLLKQDQDHRCLATEGGGRARRIVGQA